MTLVTHKVSVDVAASSRRVSVTIGHANRRGHEISSFVTARLRPIVTSNIDVARSQPRCNPWACLSNGWKPLNLSSLFAGEGEYNNQRGKMVCFAWLFFLLFKTKSNTVTLCSLKTKQEEVKSFAAAWGLALGMSLDAAAQQGSCRTQTCG